MEKNISKLHVSMNDTQVPYILDSNDQLTQDYTSLFLLDLLSNFEKNAQVVTICILLHHVDVLTCFDGLMKSDRVITFYHAMNLYLFVNTIQIFLTDVTYFNDFACVYFLGWVNS